MFRFPGQSSEGPSAIGKRTRRKKGQSESESEGEKTTVKAKKNENVADLPSKLKRLRACMICSLIKTEFEFEEDGCDNCEPFLHLVGSKGSFLGYTSGNFEGMVGLVNPEQSWVAKWQRICTMKRGIYAVNVRGKVQTWVKQEMADAGLPYYCRDKSKQQGAKGQEDKPRNRRDRRTSVESIVDENDESETNATAADDEDGIENRGEETNNENEVGEVNDVDPAPVEPDGGVMASSNNELETRSTVSSTSAYRSGRRFSSSSSDDSD